MVFKTKLVVRESNIVVYAVNVMHYNDHLVVKCEHQ